jgi:hypothetical protein
VIGQEWLVQSDLSDAAVIAASLADGARFGEIFDRHYAGINRYLARRVGSVLADEIASEVFVIAFRSRGGYDRAVGCLAAGAAVAIVLAGGGVSGSGTATADAAIIHHASAAFAAPPNEIFHSKLQGDGFVAESWQLTSAPYSYLQGKGPIGAAPYASNDGTTTAYYDPTTNTIHQTRSTKSTKPTAPDNPLAEIRHEVHDGRARVLTTATVDGTATYEIQLADKDGFDAQSLIVYVDRGSYRPIEIADPQRNGTTVRLQVVAFEYLPTTFTNLRLLSLTARYPSAQVVSDPDPAAPASGK